MVSGIAIGSIWALIIVALIYEPLFVGDSASPPIPSGPTTPDLPEWRRAWYEAAHSDIQWCKEQAWHAVKARVLLEAALVTARKWFFQSVPLDLMIIIATAASALTAIHLIDLHQFARK